MPQAKKETVSKLEAMRQAVAQLGKDVPLVDLLKFIKETHGINLDRALAYNYKSLVSKQPAAKAKGRKPGRKLAAVACEWKKEHTDQHRGHPGRQGAGGSERRR
jgi:hypothetical protein